MNKDEEKVILQNINLSGTSSRVSKIMYDAMLQAMWKCIPENLPGKTQAEIRDGVIQYLPEDLFPGGSKAGW